MRTQEEIRKALVIALQASAGSEAWDDPKTQYGALGSVMALRWVLGEGNAFSELLAEAQELFRTQAEKN